MNTISEICVLLRNGKSVRQSSDAGGLPITRIETIADGTIDPVRVGFANLLESECSDWLLQNGDILISHINSTKHLGKCAIYHGEPPALVHGMNLLVMRVDTNLANSRYAYRMLSSPGFRNQLPRITKDSVNQSSFNLSNFKNLQIPLPSIAEQKKIAAILDAVDSMRAKRRESIALLDTLLQSTFLDMFGDPVTNPMKTATLKEVAPTQSARLPSRPSDNVWQLNLDQIESQSGRILKKVIGLVSEAGSSTHFFDTGNVLYSKLRPYLNKVVCPDEPGIATTELVPLRPDPNRIDRQYLTYYLRSQRFVSWVSNEVAGAKMPRVTMKVFWDHAIPLPPLDLQCRFATIVESVEHQKALHRTHLAKLDTLFASLQQRAFNGELST